MHPLNNLAKDGSVLRSVMNKDQLKQYFEAFYTFFSAPPPKQYELLNIVEDLAPLCSKVANFGVFNRTQYSQNGQVYAVCHRCLIC